VCVHRLGQAGIHRYDPELAEHKRTGRCERLVVTGCLGERYRDELRREIPEIDAVLGTGDVAGIVAAVE
jgi:ribosomal protein S12 methylthiotransferase